tara:strand:+ start:1755 stop:2747 length:993 start_codon:yes stop_codon:yes gene_type:complete
LNILVTGSAGFIGASFCHEALRLNHKVVGIDNYSNSPESRTNILKAYSKENFKFLEFNLADYSNSLIEEFQFFKPDLIVHFAALKSVSAAEANPDLYWKNNIESTRNILNFAKKSGCSKIVFSSSAAVYGKCNPQPVNENSILEPESIYGKTKLACENLIKDFCKKTTIDAIIFRYFNVSGCHKDKLFFETTKTSQNLMMNIIDVAKNKEEISIFGNNFNTCDGSATRDYIHVEDLLSAHFTAMDLLEKINGCEVFNLGSEEEVSVLQLLRVFEESNKVKVEYKISNPRPEDLPRSLSDSSKFRRFSNWKTKKDLKDMCVDSWNSDNHRV